MGIALEIELRRFQLGFVLFLCRLRLLKCGLELTRINLEKLIAGFHLLALAEEDIGYLPADPCHYVDPVEGLHGAEAFDVNRDVVCLRGIGGHRNGLLRRAIGLAFRSE